MSLRIIGLFLWNGYFPTKIHAQLIPERYVV